MPTTTFSSFTDGLEPGQRGTGNFIANVELANDAKIDIVNRGAPPRPLDVKGR